MSKKDSSAPLSTLFDNPAKPQRTDCSGTVATMDSLEAQKRDAGGKRPTKRGGKRPAKKGLGDILEQLNESFKSEEGEDVMARHAMSADVTVDSRCAVKSEEKKPTRRARRRGEEPLLAPPKGK